MPAFIDLTDCGKWVGTFELPDEVEGKDGQKFRLIRAIRKGGNGIVFQAARVGTDPFELVAVKMLRQCESSRVDRFHNEIRILKELDHPRITKCFDEGELQLDGAVVPWVAIELGGVNLRDHVERAGRLSPYKFMRVAGEACAALSHVHARSIIHRDIKPDNFVWDPDPNGSVKMIDFGIAKRVDEDVSARPMDQFTKQMEFVGPVLYSSPELIAYSRNKTHPVDHRSDIFQLGKVLWFLATGKVSAGVPSTRDCPFGGALHAIVLSTLQDEPGERFPSVDEVLRKLEDLRA